MAFLHPSQAHDPNRGGVLGDAQDFPIQSRCLFHLRFPCPPPHFRITGLHFFCLAILFLLHWVAKFRNIARSPKWIQNIRGYLWCIIIVFMVHIIVHGTKTTSSPSHAIM